MSDALLVAVITAALNGAITWGVVSTKLAWIRQDLNDQAARLTYLERRA